MKTVTGALVKTQRQVPADPDQQFRYYTIVESLRARQISVHLNQNRQTLLSLRRHKNGGMRLSMHREFLSEACVTDELIAFALTNGRAPSVHLNRVMQEIFKRAQAAHTQRKLVQSPQSAALGEQLQRLPTIGAGYDFAACYERMHQHYFAELSKPQFAWSRNPGQRQLRSIRFGAYFSQSGKRKTEKIVLNPRLRQAWVAELFIEYIFFHELCHHRQRQIPLRGEKPHSQRFKQWEQRFPDFQLARAWERHYAAALMAAPTAEKTAP